MKKQNFTITAFENEQKESSKILLEDYQQNWIKKSYIALPDLKDQSENPKIIDINKPIIFNKKSKIVVSKPFTYIQSDTGKTRHFTPAAQEWYNSIYTYDLNYIKNLPIADKNLMNLLKSYFNIKLSKNFFNTKIKPLQIRFKRLSTKRTFVGKGHLKHTSNKVIITFFIYNTEGMFLSSLFRAMKIGTLLPKINLKYRITWGRNGDITKTYNRWFTRNEYLYEREHKGWYYSYIISLINKFTDRLDRINGYYAKLET